MAKKMLITREAEFTSKGTVRVCVSSGNVDREKEIIKPDGIDFKEFDRHPVLLSSHRTDTLTRNIGRAVSREVVDGKVYMEFEYFIGEGVPKNFEAEWAYFLAQKGIASFSVGFMPVDWKDVNKDGVRRIYNKIELFEVSQVLLPANPDAVQEGMYLTAIKEFKGGDFYEMGIKGVVPYKKFPLAPEGEPWTFQPQDKNALLGDPPNWDRYKSVHCWFDSSKPHLRESYKLPVAKMYQGSIHVFWRAVVAAMAALLGARGGVSIPDADRKGVYNRLAQYYKDFGRKPPEFKKYADDVEIYLACTNPQRIDGKNMEVDENEKYATIKSEEPNENSSNSSSVDEKAEFVKALAEILQKRGEK